MDGIYHGGEREVQNLTGEKVVADRNGSVITNKIITGAINFIEKQPLAIVSSEDSKGELWTSLLTGDIGFVKVPNPGTIIFDKKNIQSNPSDIFYANIQHHNQIGSLFIEPGTRRRFRINGSCQTKGSQIEVEVKEAYPNCPKYIQRRTVSIPKNGNNPIPSAYEGTELTNSAMKWIENADTFFIGSASAEGRLDASHRGGLPNFIEAIDHNTLKIPDYSGNSLYNTLGNIVQNPNTGLLFIDFDNGQTLQLTGKSTLLFKQQKEIDLIKTKGTGRYLLFKVSHWIHTLDHHPVIWEFVDYSPFNQ